AKPRSRRSGAANCYRR
ncbi:MAG: hypothetical protein AMXMBFR72_09940, partial [Betaproteobacteria bacterium]